MVQIQKEGLQKDPPQAALPPAKKTIERENEKLTLPSVSDPRSPSKSNRSPANNKETDLSFEELTKKATPFLEKFNRQRDGYETPFREGELIKAKFQVHPLPSGEGGIDPTKLELRVPNIDVRNADSFIISVDPKLHEQLLKSPVIIYDGVVKVSGIGRNGLSNAYRYPSELLALKSEMAVNPDAQTLGQKELGDRVIVRGQIIALTKDSNWNKIDIKNDTGRISSVLLRGDAQFEYSPAMERISGKVAEVGDIVDILATVGFSAPLNGGSDMPVDGSSKVLTASSIGSTYLVTPSKNRQARFDTERQTVSTNLQSFEKAISDKDFKKAREVFSTLIKQELIQSETKQRDELRNRMPEVERPIRIVDRYHIDALNKGLNVDLDQMTADEFFKFALERTGKPFQLQAIEKTELDETYLYTLLEKVGLTSEQQESLFLTAVRSRMECFQQQAEHGEKFNRERDWNDYYFLKGSLARLSQSGSLLAAREIISALTISAEHVGRGTTLGEIHYDVTKSLMSLVATASKEGRQDTLDYIKDSRSQLEKARETLHKQDPARYRDEIENISKVLQATQPLLTELRGTDFKTAFETKLTELGKRSPSVEAFAAKIKEANYKIDRLDNNNPNLPEIVRSFNAMNPSLAVTVTSVDPQQRAVYFNISAIEAAASYANLSNDEKLVEVIANELVHVTKRYSLLAYTNDDAKDAVERLRRNEPIEDVVERLNKLIVDEVVSDLIGKGALKRLTQSDFFYDKNFISTDSDEFLLHTVSQLKGPAMQVFGVDFADPEVQVLASLHVLSILKSEGFIETIRAELQQFGFYRD